MDFQTLIALYFQTPSWCSLMLNNPFYYLSIFTVSAHYVSPMFFEILLLQNHTAKTNGFVCINHWRNTIYSNFSNIAYLNHYLTSSGGLYDRGKDLNWKQIKDFEVMGAMGKAGGGRNEVSSNDVVNF